MDGEGGVELKGEKGRRKELSLAVGSVDGNVAVWRYCCCCYFYCFICYYFIYYYYYYYYFYYDCQNTLGTHKFGCRLGV